MKPSQNEVQQMVMALFSLVEGLERARRRIPDASTLSVLQIIAAHEKIHPSEIASELDVHQSTITRQIQLLEDAGKVAVILDPDDRRSCLLTLTEAGIHELGRLTQIGLARFESFVADWDVEDVRTFTRLLIQFEESKSSVARRERRSGRHWQVKEE